MPLNRYLIQGISTDRGVNTIRVEELHRFTIEGKRLVFDSPDSDAPMLCQALYDAIFIANRSSV